MNTGLQEFHTASRSWDIHASHPGVVIQNDVRNLPSEIRVVGARQYLHAPPQFRIHGFYNAIGSTELEDGKYLYSPTSGQIEVHWIQGIGSASAPTPQARLMATADQWDP